MANVFFNSNGTLGAGYIFAASGLLNDLKKMEETHRAAIDVGSTADTTATAKIDAFQAGEIFLTGANEVTATGTFRTAYSAAPYVAFTPQVTPSGAFWISASGTSTFTVTFATSPNGGGTPFTSYKLGTWMSYPYPH